MISLMKLLSIVEPLGGLALVVGFLTQIAAVGLVIIMLGAIYMKTKMINEPFTSQEKAGWEFVFILLASCIALLFNGAKNIALNNIRLGI